MSASPRDPSASLRGDGGERTRDRQGGGGPSGAEGRDRAVARDVWAVITSFCPVRRLWTFVLLAASSALGGCGSLPVARFAETPPRFEPERYFAGPTHSWGVFEDGSANPRKRFTTDAVGRWEKGGLSLAQTFTFDDGSQQHRLWSIRRVDAHRYTATASDVVGTATGEAYGNAFRWEYTVALRPGNPLSHVRLKQWMYLQPDGRTVMNRGTIRKLGLPLAQVSETFERPAPVGRGRR